MLLFQAVIDFTRAGKGKYHNHGRSITRLFFSVSFYKCTICKNNYIVAVNSNIFNFQRIESLDVLIGCNITANCYYEKDGHCY